MKKYRIKEYVRANGSSFFELQERFLCFWLTYDGWQNFFSSKEQAEKVISELEANIIIKTKIHE